MIAQRVSGHAGHQYYGLDLSTWFILQFIFDLPAVYGGSCQEDPLPQGETSEHVYPHCTCEIGTGWLLVGCVVSCSSPLGCSVLCGCSPVVSWITLHPVSTQCGVGGRPPTWILCDCTAFCPPPYLGEIVQIGGSVPVWCWRSALGQSLKEKQGQPTATQGVEWTRTFSDTGGHPANRSYLLHSKE